MGLRFFFFLTIFQRIWALFYHVLSQLEKHNLIYFLCNIIVIIIIIIIIIKDFINEISYKNL